MPEEPLTDQERVALRTASGGGRSRVYLEDQTDPNKMLLGYLVELGLLEARKVRGRTFVRITQAGRDALRAHGDTSY